MAAPGEQSALRSALAHPDQAVKDAFIQRIVQVYGENQDLTRTAAAFACSRRTLERAIEKCPELAAEIAKVRDGIRATS